MRFHEVKDIPYGKNTKYRMMKLQAELEEFVAMSIPMAKVSGWDVEYKNIKSAYESLRQAAKRWELPINVMTSKGNVYLIRTDMV